MRICRLKRMMMSAAVMGLRCSNAFSVSLVFITSFFGQTTPYHIWKSRRFENF